MLEAAHTPPHHSFAKFLPYLSLLDIEPKFRYLFIVFAMARYKPLIAIVLWAFVIALYITSWQEPQEDSFVTTASTPQDILNNLRQDWWKLGEDAREAGQTVIEALNAIDLDEARQKIDDLPQALKTSVGHIPVSQLKDWLMSNAHSTMQELKDILEDLRAVDIHDLPQEIVDYIKEHPEEVAIFVVETAILFVPGGVYGPVLRRLGFTKLGVRGRKYLPAMQTRKKLMSTSGSIAALIQSMIGARVPARGWFAHLVSAMMGGYGKKVVSGWTRVGIKVASWLGFWGSHRDS